MPLQDLTPPVVFMASALPDIPAAYVGAIIGPLSVAVTALWKWQIASIEKERERERADAKANVERLEVLARESWAGVRDAATASQEVITVVKAQGAVSEQIRADLAYLRIQLGILVGHREAS